MITEAHILRFYPDAARSEPIFRAAVLDTAFDLFLSEMRRRGLFEVCEMVFKGGTALRKFQFGHKSRFSFDLDFEAADGAAEIIAGELDGYSSHGFVFGIGERRGHRSLQVASPLFSGGFYDVKMDFSHRGCWLSPDEREPLASPVLTGQVWDEEAAVPILRVEENVAEKLSRWQNRPLVRDLYDLAAIANDIDDLALVAKMYVLKSHNNYMAALPSRRPRCAAQPLGDVTASAQPSDFDLDDLVQPRALTDNAKAAMIRDALSVVQRLTETVDGHIENTPLAEIAADTGSLGWKVDQEIQSLQTRCRVDDLDEQTGPPLGAALDDGNGGFGDAMSFSRGVCAKWMPVAKTRCVLTAHHGPPCRSKR